jgi:acyl-CoA synthetase (AMP-forming)/AMP-acid ligase II
MSNVFATLAHSQPDKIALIEDRAGNVRSRTYAELESRTNQLARVLGDHGVGPGDRMVWCGRNSMSVVEALVAAEKIGATAVPLNYRLTDEESAYIIGHCDATAAFADAEFAGRFDRIGPDLPSLRTVFVADGEPIADQVRADDLLSAASDSPLPEPVAGGATIIYTSGTTGRPKGAYRSNEDDSDSYSALLEMIGYRNDDVHVTTGPIYHSGPGAFLWIALAYGQTVVLQRNFDPEDWLRLVDTYRCTNTFSAPTPIRSICNLPAAVKDGYDRSSMRTMIANAAPWPFALKEQYVRDFPPESLWEVYGSTELGVNTVLAPEAQMRKPGSCGLPAPSVEIRLYDDKGELVEGTGPEAAGELYVRSGSTFTDYYKQHDKFEEDQRDGFQTVGDVAYRDDEGYYYICDRKKDMIISGGMNIYPAEIEAALEAHVDVYEAAVFGIPSDDWGESVHAVVVLRSGAAVDRAALEAHLRSRLAGYKVPRSFEWADELPKTGSGKILKRELRAPHWAGQSTNI